MFSGIGLPEILIVLVIALVVLGPKRLPETGRSLGRGLREFKDSIAGNDKDDDELAGLGSTSSYDADDPAKSKSTTTSSSSSGTS